MSFFQRLFLSALCAGFFTTAVPAQTITLLHVNDTHSNLAPIGPRDETTLKGSLGGIARAATLIGQTRALDSNVLFLHAGDLFTGDLFFNRYFGVPEFQILKSLGCDAMAVGNHEFDLTPFTLLQSLQTAFPDSGFPLLSANINLEDSAVTPLKQYIQPYTIREFGNVKVGIFGLTTPATNALSLPQPVVVSENFPQIAGSMVTALRAQGCQVVILLSHLGYAYDRLVVRNVPGIDIIVGGHDHLLFTEPRHAVDPMGDTTWILQANAFYLNMGRMRFDVVQGRVSIRSYEMIALNESVPEEPNIAGMIAQLQQDIEGTYGPLFTTKISSACEHLEEVAPVDSLMNGSYETIVGRLVTRAFHWKTKTDIAVTVVGSIAQPLYKGPIVPADAFRVLGYGFNMDNGLGYRLATFDMSGAGILSGLEFGLSQIDQNDEFVIIGSGLSYRYDPAKPPLARLLEATINGKPVDPDSTYSVTSNEFTPAFLSYLGIPFENLNIVDGLSEFQVLAEYLSYYSCIDSKTVLTSFKREAAPSTVQLDQNYPNPFNPGTIIPFALRTRGWATLTVSSLMGDVLTTLVSGMLETGSYTVPFDAASLPGGLYIYTLTITGESRSRVMILVK